jgi:hypothetical protein
MLMTKNVRLARRWMIALLAAVLLSGTAITLAYPATLAGLTGTAGSGFDPLTPSEQMRALQALQRTGAAAQGLQLPSEMALRAVPMGTTPDTDGVPPAPAEELLLVERHNEEKQVYAQGRWPRRADVYIYRYADDTLIRQIYNMDTNQVDAVEQVQGVQLPLTDGETQRAMAIALADPNVRPMLDAEYRSITQQDLVAAEQLIVKAMTFHASSIPAEDVGSAAACGVKRCAQLLLAAGDNVALQVIPVVDLSSGIVVNALPFNRAPR